MSDYTMLPIVLPPRAELRIPISENDTREPVLWGEVGTITMQRATPGTLLLTNTTDHIANSTLVFAPAVLVRLGKIPWAEIGEKAKSYFEKVVAEVMTGKPSGR